MTTTNLAPRSLFFAAQACGKNAKSITMVKSKLKAFANIIKSLINNSIINTVIFNFKYFPFSIAINFPVLIGNNASYVHLEGRCKIESEVTTGMISIGRKSHIDIIGTLRFNGKATFGEDSGFFIAKDATLTLGHNFNVARTLRLNCKKMITIKDNVLIADNCKIYDTDFHDIFNNQMVKLNSDEPIVIGNKVWIGLDTIILKGTQISDNVVLGAGSVVAGNKLEANSVYGGNPVKKLKASITWEY